LKIIDIHTHGIDGYETRGARSGDILEMAQIHGSLGTEAIVPTIFPAPVDEMRSDMAAVKEAMEQQREGKTARGAPEARILGVHLEGPFLNPSKAGALDGGSFLPATRDTWMRLVDGFARMVRIITVAPELQGATELIENIAGMGIIVSMGHSDATYGEAEAGFRAGARGITHIFNAMRVFHHREPGIAGFALMNPDVYVEVIADPYHLDAKTVGLVFEVKDPGRIMIVSDTVKASVSVSQGKAVTDAAGGLLGGSMALTESVKRLIRLGFDRDHVERAVGQNPAGYLGT